MEASPSAVLAQYAAQFGPVLPIDLNSDAVCRLDFTSDNYWLVNQNLANTAQFAALVHKLLQQQNASVGLGGYLENRVIYRRSALFAGPEANRSIHLGVDIWAPAGTPVLVPLAAQVHSWQDNARFGDYGPTIILEHALPNLRFYTLYGHLSQQSLEHLRAGDTLEKGQTLGAIGSFPENGDWPPHLHFQVITDMQGRQGDFPGVCTPAEKITYAHLCPDPNLILQSRHLTAF